jgi:hypothetical protein
MATIPSSSIYTDRVLSRVCLGGVQSDLATLVAVGGVCGPRSLIPTIFETLSDLCDGSRGERKRKRKESGLSKHDCGCDCGCEAAG